MEELIGAVVRGASRIGRGAVWLYELVGPTPDEDRDPGRPRQRHRDGGGPRLTEDEIREAEAEFGITFPAEYRTYLLEPFGVRGVNPLRRTPEGWRWETSYTIDYHLLADDFPHPDTDPDARMPSRDDFSDAAAFEAAYEAWDAELNAYTDRMTDGCVVIQDGGCGFSTLLVVTGPLAGTVWFDATATTERIMPLKSGGRSCTFGNWVRGRTRSTPF
ncbi:SMI1/KNR4 family protein [Streptomyces sp. NPDC094448]|uniref:SMI1/KNR4 family protein n=1 Tax=Streptomyces sp. NPDC094448 TaxID=3366063 RepID=UPI003813FA7E